MSERELSSEGNLLSALASMIGGAVCISFPLALLIIGFARKAKEADRSNSIVQRLPRGRRLV
jgi:hypothetical protein